MRALVLAGLVIGAATGASADSTPRQDALLRSYFAIWDRDADVTMDNVRRLYGPHIVYYGHAMTREDLLADKRAFIRRWPERRYDVEPGTAVKTCDAAETRCRLSANLLWRTEAPGRTRAGRSRVSLTLARTEGELKIVREGGVTLGR
jgi:hypothetical protein